MKGSFTPIMPVDNNLNAQLMPSPWVSTANLVFPCYGDTILFVKKGLATTEYYI